METGKSAGRPLKFASVADLEIKIETYFGECDPHRSKRIIVKEKANGGSYIAEEDYITDQLPYTITGLAVALDTSRKVLLDYESGKYDDPDKSADESELFSNTVAHAKQKCEAYAEAQLFTGKTPAGPIFSLSNNYARWKHKVEEDTTVRNVKGDLDDLDKSHGEAAAEAAKALEEAKHGAPGPATPVEVVEADASLQDQG